MDTQYKRLGRDLLMGFVVGAVVMLGLSQVPRLFAEPPATQSR
jgi:hypothetical protein